MKNGFRVLDSDLHTMEPDGLWERYLDEPFKGYAPRFVRPAEGAPNQPIIKIGAMDIEGIDVAVIYGTRGRQVLMHDDLPPEVAAALARAHNNWTRDFCAVNPERLKFAAQLAFHDVTG